MGLLAVAALGGCNDMGDQPKGEVYGASDLTRDGAWMQPPPAGTAEWTPTGRTIPAVRPPMSLALVQRGRERYGIYCAACHGAFGSGDGTVPRRGFPKPPNLASAQARALTDRRLFDIASQGKGVMYGFADRVPASDRWAMVAYIRALQISHGTRAKALNGDELRRIESRDGD